MNKQLHALIGIPGSGKSSVMRSLVALSGYDTFSQQEVAGCPHIVYTRHSNNEMPPTMVELGVKRSAFPGTDGMSLSIMPKAIAFLAVCPYDLVVFEGDRLASKKFFEAARGLKWDLHVIFLNIKPEIAAERRALRGSHQNPTWLKGRETKVYRLGLDADMVIPIVNTKHTPMEYAEMWRTYILETRRGRT